MGMLKKYENFTETDFINDPDFQDWIISPNEEKNSFWKTVVDVYPGKTMMVESARKTLQSIAFDEKWPSGQKIENALSIALKQINAISAPVISISQKADRKASFGKWWAAAAILLLLASASVYFLVFAPKQIGTPNAPDLAGVNIAPGGDKAVLTLANGKKIVLDTASNGDLEHEGNVKIIKLDGQVAYNKEGQSSKEVLYNTITTPRGGQYQLVLSDGTKVWLNAESSLRFPTSFPGAEREVSLSGEGYFEVAHNRSQPFRVTVNDDTKVEVLGTHFNVMAYTDETAVKTTLLEGAVKVTKEGNTQLLSPGQQAQVNSEGNIALVDNADTEEALAWKNGLFQFTGADMGAVMRQIGRWYDLNVHLKGNISSVHLTGKVQRNLNLSQLIMVLEESGIEVTVNGKEITASPKP